jgi:hypothetical protein
VTTNNTKETNLTAKHKLNSIYLIAALVVAAIVGAMTESFLVFLITAGVLIGCALHDRSIRVGEACYARPRRRPLLAAAGWRWGRASRRVGQKLTCFSYWEASYVAFRGG